MIYTGASIRELQLARGLITLRWTSIPLLFGFSLFCLDFLNLSFKFEPIYLLCCALAIFNVYFTVHVSLLSRQMALNSGMSTLKRGLVRIAFSGYSADLFKIFNDLPGVCIHLVCRFCALSHKSLLIYLILKTKQPHLNISSEIISNYAQACNKGLLFVPLAKPFKQVFNVRRLNRALFYCAFCSY
jgi:hypothetical protein